MSTYPFQQYPFIRPISIEGSIQLERKTAMLWSYVNKDYNDTDGYINAWADKDLDGVVSVPDNAVAILLRIFLYENYKGANEKLVGYSMRKNAETNQSELSDVRAFTDTDTIFNPRSFFVIEFDSDHIVEEKLDINSSLVNNEVILYAALLGWLFDSNL